MRRYRNLWRKLFREEFLLSVKKKELAKRQKEIQRCENTIESLAVEIKNSPIFKQMMENLKPLKTSRDN